MISSEDKKRLTVGYKQVCKAIKSGSCEKIFLAEDCSSNMSDNIRVAAGGIEIVNIPTMRELGDICEIDVPASCAALIRL